MSENLQMVSQSRQGDRMTEQKIDLD